MLRITGKMMTQGLKRDLNTNLRNLEKYEKQLSSGRKINLPSDDPAGLIKALRLRSNINTGEQYISNINEATSFMETTDSALNNVGQILNRTRELTVQAANGTNSTDDLKAIAVEIRELNQQLKEIANTTYGTKYIFGGTNVTEAPVRGNSWLGTNRSLELEIGVNVKINMNLTDQNMNFLFTDTTTGTTDPAEMSLFNLMGQMATDIENGNTSNINTELSCLDAKIDDVLTSRASLGARINRLELQSNRLEDTNTSYTSLLANTEDADIAEVYMNLKTQENIYNASLAAGAKIIQPSLIDFIR